MVEMHVQYAHTCIHCINTRIVHIRGVFNRSFDAKAAKVTEQIYRAKNEICKVNNI